MEQLDSMRQNDRTTLNVDFSHLELANQTLADAIQAHYYRFDKLIYCCSFADM